MQLLVLLTRTSCGALPAQLPQAQPLQIPPPQTQNLLQQLVGPEPGEQQAQPQQQPTVTAMPAV